MRHALVLALLLAALPAHAGGGRQDKKPRPFLMGSTYFPHDLTLEAFAELQTFLEANVDLVSRKLDEGVPWPEATADLPYAPELDKKIQEESVRPEGKRLLLAVTPLNGDKTALAPYRGAAANQPLAGAWAQKDFDDPAAARAYLSYCREVVRRARPDALIYGIEVNQLAEKNPTRWKKFVLVVRDIYVSLKKENPDLPLLLSVQLETFYANEAAQRRAVRDILPFSDYAAVATLPNLVHTNPAKIPRDYLSKVAALAPGKPLAVVDTAFLGEDLRIGDFERVGKPAWQDEYLRWLLEDCARLNAKIVVYSIPRDYDLLWEKLLRHLPLEFLKIMRDTGLLDGDGKPRKAFETWKDWHGRNYKP